MTNVDRKSFGFDTTTDEVLAGLDLQGRRFLVTGGSSGLGAETVRALAAKGADVVFTGRDVAKARAVIDSVRASTGNDAVKFVELELGSLEDVRRAADEILRAHEAFDVIINNAGIMACPQGTTVDGFERQFGTNHLGHFLFTGLLVPALQKGDSPRIVNLSSRAHHISGIDFDDLHWETRPYEKWSAYGQSKTANVLFTVELERRLAPHGIHAYALHPGVIMTDLQRHLVDADAAFFEERQKAGLLKLKTVEQGAATQVYAATAPELEGIGGVYLEDVGIAAEDEQGREGGVRPYALDKEAARELWQRSEEMVAHEFSW